MEKKQIAFYISFQAALVFVFSTELFAVFS